MAELLRTSQANIDLLEIWLFIAEDNSTAADRWTEDINEKCKMLAEFPELGQRCDNLAKSLRCFSVGNYVIFYRPVENGINLIRVISGARDIEALFRTDADGPID